MQMRRLKRWQITLLSFVLLMGLSFAVSTAPANSINLKIGAGSKEGAYYQFGQNLKKALTPAGNAALSLEIVATDGTLENLSLLEKHEIDIAIIQNDIGNYVYSGKYGYRGFDEFSGLLPLFPEYLQVIVPINSEIKLLGNLRGRSISVGPRRSGSHRNALDLFQELGWRSDVDFRELFLPPDEGLSELEKGDIDAVIHTGANLPISNNSSKSSFRTLAFSQSLVHAVSARFPYYSATQMPPRIAPSSGENSALSVTAYLVIGDHVPEATVRQLGGAILQAWPYLTKMPSSYDLIPLGDGLGKIPFPYHPEMTSLLEESGYLEINRRNYVLIALGAWVFIVVAWAQRKSESYDRLGNISLKRRHRSHQVILLVARFGTFIYIALLFLTIITSLVYAIQHFEARYAREMNINNDFANVGFQEAFLWLYMFMGSGETGNLFPLSTEGKILTALIPAIGISTLLGYLYLAIELKRRSKMERIRGHATPHLKDHVLICGWNDKSAGIIYALTSKDSPAKRHVVVIAELEGDAPLESYNFDPKYVYYCRGSSAQHGTLERANAHQANTALIVASYKKKYERNLDSILTVMALKNAGRYAESEQLIQGQNLFVAAEMVFDENRSHFEICDVDALVHRETIVNRVIAQACCNEFILDFVLDMLTYDEYDELYSASVESLTKPPYRRIVSNPTMWISGIKLFVNGRINTNELKNASPLVGTSLNEARIMLAPFGINFIGVICSKTKAPLIDHSFDKKSPYRLWVNNPGHLISSTDSIIYTAGKNDDIYTALAQLKPIKQASQTDTTIRFPTPKTRKICLIGDSNRCNRIATMLKGVSSWIDVSIHGIDSSSSVNEPRDIEDLSLPLNSADAIAIISASQQNDTGKSEEDLQPLDALTLFRTRAIKRMLSTSNVNGSQELPMIVAEMIGRNNRQFFDEAGVDVAVPCSLLVERVLTKLVFSRGNVANLLLALLDFNDGVYLTSITLDGKLHADLIGKTFHDLMFGLSNGIQLIGWLPKSGRHSFANTKTDFEWHFITSPDRFEDKKRQTMEGDQLILIVDRRTE